jgi:hypothetical protein
MTPMKPGTRTRVPRVAALVVLVATLAACSRGGEGGENGASARAQVEPVYRELAQCIRNNGYPDFPDPVVKDDGTVELPPDVARTLEERRATLEAACQDIVERLPASLQGDQEAQVTPAQIAERKQFAKCVREHGVPEFPDPDASGEIVLSGQFAGGRLTPAAVSAFEACGLRGKQAADMKRSLNDLGVR